MLIIHFRLGINSPQAFFDMTEAGKVNAGRHTTFSIRPLKVGYFDTQNISMPSVLEFELAELIKVSKFQKQIFLFSKLSLDFCPSL